MGLHNEYLKHKNWKNISYSNNAYADIVDGCYDDCDIIPVKQSMRDSAKYGNCGWKPYREHTYYSDKWKTIRNKMEKFLRSHIGKSYDKTYSEFRDNFPHQFGKIDVIGEFKARFLDIAHLARYERRKVYFNNPFAFDWSYYVDEQGIIRNMCQETEKTVPKKKRQIEVNVLKEEWVYSFNPVVFEDGAVNAIVVESLPHSLREYVAPGKIFSHEVYCEMSKYFQRGTFNEDIKNIRSERWWEKHGYRIETVYDYKWNYETKTCTKTFKGKVLNYDSVFNFILTKKMDKECEYLDANTAECKRYLNERSQKINAANRIRKQENEKKLSTLLSDITHKRNYVDEEKNRVDRDRLGFDENSFKGEFYHGQKRKKK